MLRPSAEGLEPVANVVVEGLVCLDLSTCLTQPDSLFLRGQTTTNSIGAFRLSFVSFPGQIGVLRAQIDGTELRAVVDCSGSDVSPISEAATRLLAARAAHSYGTCGLSALASDVYNANRDTDFSGLTIPGAIAVALAAAEQDPAVLQALLTPTPTPTRTDTPTLTATPTTTPTATHTFRATATAGPCPGDCDTSGSVASDDLDTGVQVALGKASRDVCPSMDRNRDGRISVDEVLHEVNVAVVTCAAAVALPDLTITQVEAVRPPGCGVTDEVVVQVCVANLGDVDVGPSQVVLDQGREVFDVTALHAGEEQCSIHQRAGDQVAVTVDPSNLVAESDEGNNSTMVTLIEPPVRVTCTPTITPTRTPSPTPT